MHTTNAYLLSISSAAEQKPRVARCSVLYWNAGNGNGNAGNLIATSSCIASQK